MALPRLHTLQRVLKSSVTVATGRGLTLRYVRSSVAVNKIFDITKEEEFKTKVLSAEKPVIVDFHANWCGPCRILGPDLEEVVARFSDEVDLVKVDIDVFPELAMSNEVTSIPAVQAFVQGERKSSFVGTQHTDFLTNFVKDVISS